MKVGKLFEDADAPVQGERFDTLLKLGKLHVERIVSSADLGTPQVCVQTQDEWVLLLKGDAELEVAGAAHALTAGDHLFLPAGVPHKVLATSPGAMWLAVHLHPVAGSDEG